MFGNFTEEARKVLLNAKQQMLNLKHPYVGSEHLILAILSNNNNVTKTLKKYKVTYDTFKEKLIEVVGVGSKESEWFLYTPLLKRVMENSIIDSKEENKEVTINNLFYNILEEGEGIAIRIIINLGINIEDLYQEFNPKNTKVKTKKKLIIEELGINLTKQAEKKLLDPVIGRDEEVKRLLEILCRRTKNNPILIGEAGVGKTAIVEHLSQLIVNNEVPNNLKDKKIYSLDMASLVAGTKYRGEFEERIRKVLKEVEENDDIIVFIDEIHTLVGAGGAEGAIDASNIFKPALARNKLRCIGATTTDEYKKFIESDKALERRFQKVNIEIPDNKTVKQILMKIKPIYESYHKVTIEENIIDKIITLSEKYIHDRNQPDKSIDILDEVCSKTSLKENKINKLYNQYVKELQQVIKQKKQFIKTNQFTKAKNIKNKECELTDKINNIELQLCKNNKKQVTINDVATVIYSKTKIPIYEITNDIKTFNKINNNLGKKIIGQEQAIKELINISKKLKLGYKDDDKPYSLLFVGPSGVGKTELAKQFGNILVGNNIIKLDMSEFQESHSISKFIGSPPGYIGYNDNKNILEEIKNKPFTVLILDEIESANKTIINLLYQILDEGHIKNSKGKDIYFNNTIIIMTSNVGYHTNSVGFNNTKNSKLKEHFPIPFINRIDNIINFNTLTKENIENIISNKITQLINKYKQKNIKIKINKETIEEIIKSSQFQEFGARKINKIIKNKIEDFIIDEIIENKKEIKLKKEILTT